MIGVLPAPYPDELVHGIMARYARQFATPESLETLSGLRWLGIEAATQFGMCSAANVVRLGAYTEPQVVIERLLHEHTLLPHCLLFYAEATRRALLSEFATDSSHHAESSAEQIQVPFGARKISFGLKYCPECAAEDRQSVGEAYWHVEHQGQGTALCLRHDCWLWVGPLIRRRLVVGPCVFRRSERRPMGHGRPKPVVRQLCELDRNLRGVQWRGDLALELRRALLSALRRGRTDERAREIGYPDGWRVFGSKDWTGKRKQLWDAGLVCIAALGPHRLTRDIWRLTRSDRPINCVIGQVLQLGVDIDALRAVPLVGDETDVAGPSREAVLFKDIELCGDRYCENYAPDYQARMMRRRDQFMEQIDGSCGKCGWRGTARVTGIVIRDFGTAFKREALRLATRTMLTHAAQAQELGVSPSVLMQAWRLWQRSGESVDGRCFQTRVAPERRGIDEAKACRQTPIKSERVIPWKLRPGLQFVDPQYDGQAVTWSGPDIARYERIIAATKSVTASEAAEILKCGRDIILYFVFCGRLLTLRKIRALLLPLSQFNRQEAMIRPEYAALFKEAVAAKVDAWDLAEQLSQRVAIDDEGRTLHQIVMAREQELVKSVVEELAHRRTQAACRSRPQ